MEPRRPLACKPRRRRIGLWLALTMFFPIVLSAQAAAAQDIFIYPAKGQSQTQQDKDRYECHLWAVKNSGYDPSKPQAASNSGPPQPDQSSQHHVLRGAGRGAALGAVGGAITGNAGQGAAAGAAMGGLAGGFRRRDERRQQSQQQQASAQQAQQSRSTAYTRALAACLEGRGYTVK
jgi:hypothetical protein